MVQARKLVLSIALGAWSVARAAVAQSDVPELPAPPPLAPAPRGLQRGAGDRLEWSYPELAPAEYAIAAGSVLAGFVALAVGPNEDNPRRGGVLIDESVRDSLRAGTPTARRVARDASDLMLSLTTSYPILVDSVIDAAWYRNSAKAAAQMALITSEVYAVTFGVQLTVAVAMSRERPFGRECGDEVDDNNNDCVSSNRYRSYFSGHTSMAFAAAAVTCSHHANVPLHGGGAIELVPCLGAFGLAGATGAFRIVSDQHYFTDVATGAVWGALVGFGLPWLLHYRHGDTARDETGAAFRIQVVPVPGGLGLGGAF
jgi:membrane-associated phospholipid phosphatase